MVEVAPARLCQLSTRILQAAGAPVDVATEVAEHLVGSNLAGHDSHGVIRVAWYLEHIRDGWLRPDARPELLREAPAAALVTGEWGFGHPAARLAMDQAVERALEHGLGAAGLVRATHLGRLGTYTERAAARGCVALMWLGGLGTQRAAVPFGGSSPVYGTNPVSAAFPAAEAGTALLDYATTKISGGKIMVARDEGRALPPGSIVDSRGEPSTDPRAFFEGGAILPFGEHKGYALAVFAQLLGQSLTGAETTAGEAGGGLPFSRSGSFFLAVRPDLFRPAEETVGAAARFLEELRAVPPAAGFERVLAPGDPEARARSERAGAIPLPDETWRSLREAATSVRVSAD